MYTVESFGSFYIGGRAVHIENQPTKRIKRNQDVTVEVDPNGDYVIEAIYVQYFLPKDYKTVCVLIHGGGHTGAVWENTPDGRKGWLHLLLQLGIGVYIIDSVERGRAGWCSIKGIWEGEPELRSNQRTWDFFRLGSKNGVPFENSQFPIESFQTLTKYNVPRWNCNAEASSLIVRELIEKIGSCTLIAHSQGADIALRCLNFIPKLIKNIVLIEPAAFPKLDTSLSFIDRKALILFGDYISYNPFWISMKEKAISFKEDLLKCGLKVELILLPEVGIFGNSHMIMMDKNNDTILELIVRRLISSNIGLATNLNLVSKL